MKSPALLSLVLLGVCLAATACSHLDLSPTVNPNRVVSGTVNCRSSLPAGAQVRVRVVDLTPNEAPAVVPRPELPLGDRGKMTPVAEEVLGEQTFALPAMTTEPVPFRVEFTADDTRLRHGLNLDVRISVAGHVRFRTINAHVITLASVPFRQELWVDPVQ